MAFDRHQPFFFVLKWESCRSTLAENILCAESNPTTHPEFIIAISKTLEKLKKLEKKTRVS